MLEKRKKPVSVNDILVTHVASKHLLPYATPTISSLYSQFQFVLDSIPLCPCVVHMLRDMDIMEDINDIRRVRKTLLLTPYVIRVGIPMISYTVQGRAALEVSCTASRNSKKTDQ